MPGGAYHLRAGGPRRALGPPEAGRPGRERDVCERGRAVPRAVVLSSRRRAQRGRPDRSRAARRQRRGRFRCGRVPRRARPRGLWRGARRPLRHGLRASGLDRRRRGGAGLPGHDAYPRDGAARRTLAARSRRTRARRRPGAAAGRLRRHRGHLLRSGHPLAACPMEQPTLRRQRVHPRRTPGGARRKAVRPGRPAAHPRRDGRGLPERPGYRGGHDPLERRAGDRVRDQRKPAARPHRRADRPVRHLPRYHRAEAGRGVTAPSRASVG